MIKKFKYSSLVIGLLLTSAYSSLAVAGPEPKFCDDDFVCFLFSTTVAPTFTVVAPFKLTSDQFNASDNGSSGDHTKALKAGYNFYEKNYQQIKEDTARGDGPFLHAFCDVIFSDLQHWRPFKAAMRQQYSDYFSLTKPSASSYRQIWDLRNNIIGGDS